MISSCCHKFFSIFKNFFSKIDKLFQKSNYNPEYGEINTSSTNEENKPAKILSSEEINEMINNQIKYSKENTNTNEYKIIKQKTNEDMPKTGELLNVEEIKNEINQIEFEEEEQKKKSKKNTKIENGIIEDDNYEEEKNNEENLDNNEEEDDINLNIEDLKKDVLENNDDD